VQHTGRNRCAPSHPPFTPTPPRYTLSRNVLAPEGNSPITVRRVSGPRCASARKKAGSGESGRATSLDHLPGVCHRRGVRGRVCRWRSNGSARISPTRKRCRPTRMCRIRSTCYPRGISFTRHLQRPAADLRCDRVGVIHCAPLWTPTRCECGRRVGESQCRYRVDNGATQPDNRSNEDGLRSTLRARAWRRW
jgi:hypothetical protein